MNQTKKITLSAACLALCCVLPGAFHSLGLGSAFSPLHIPVLLCGLVCGPLYGALCGLLGPILSCVITGMPDAAMLVSMVPELICYGFVTGLSMVRIRTGRMLADIYIAMGIAMVLGRIIGGVAKALFYLGGEGYSLSIWATAYFVTSFPGIVLHLILVPMLVVTLTKARLIPGRYEGAKQ